jgi:hypothetical protein
LVFGFAYRDKKGSVSLCVFVRRYLTIMDANVAEQAAFESRKVSPGAVTLNSMVTVFE